MNTKTVLINEIGEVLLRKNSRSKYMSIAIKSTQGVVVTMPTYYSYEEGIKFAYEKTEWIKRGLEKLKQSKFAPVVYDGQTPVKTRSFIIEFEKSESKTVFIEGTEHKIVFKYPASKDIKSPEMQKKIKLVLEHIYRLEAHEYLPQRIDALSKQYNIPFNRLSIKNIKSRWGSCSARNNINLSIYLMKLPDELIDYVISHELAHVIVKNHSKKFWLFLEKLTGNAKKLDKLLKNYRTQ